MAKKLVNILKFPDDETDYEVYDQQARTDSSEAKKQSQEALTQVGTLSTDVRNLKDTKLSGASLKSSYTEDTKTLTLSIEVTKE